jgi:DNA-binding NarL/FixJ family response regulator
MLIADRRPAAVWGLAAAFDAEPDVVVQARCHEAEQLSTVLASGRRIDAAVVDPEMFDGDAARAVEAIRHLDQGVAVLLLTTQVDEALLDALAQKRVSCVSAYSEAEPIVSALRALLRGETRLPTQVQDALTERLRGPVSPPIPQLTRREEQVLELAATGLTISEIAAELSISRSTAKAHLLRVYEKLEAPNRTAAVVTAVARGMLRVSTAAA